MENFSEAFFTAVGLIFAGDPALWFIVYLSLKVSLSAVILAVILGVPLGALLAITEFRCRNLIIVFINALMGLPPVVVGLCVYLLLSNSGPLGVLQLLYTPTAMIIAQTILVTPIIAALSREIVQGLHEEYRDQLLSLSLGKKHTLSVLLWDARYSLVVISLAGFGRAIAEVGAVMIVGGNINHVTRVMTTAIALETSKGNLSMALALGCLLVVLAIIVNMAVSLVGFQRRAVINV